MEKKESAFRWYRVVTVTLQSDSLYDLNRVSNEFYNFKPKTNSEDKEHYVSINSNKGPIIDKVVI